ncbi:hypothetical protein VC83_00915 [Pseudogymnoascus destructans]|uniref:Seipin n=2 Tax=Pseudogymnoascus destructans TaxID=655981 RepID=L8FL82_PSED2|nr:uncharacterized protein VC83_00915 [Pseudogymnoascus destructans]ELR01687.1 hypothetical protein GMDG_00063 [Pseudogymnoascus destructans 20631-21]OAF62291.1 hypothetical protein VC83_00915 [Pseudogymnoascus destructans]
MDLILRSIRLASSKAARKAYLNTALFLATSATLFGLAVVAYVLFYVNYIPKIGIEREVHLQYGGDASSPYGLVSLDNSVMPQQAYDILVEIDLPTSPANSKLGNFMVDMVMLSSEYKDSSRPGTSTSRPSDLHSWIPAGSILFSSRRPAILTFRSDVVSLGKQLAGLPLYILGWHRESERLRIPMAEGIVFENGNNNAPRKVYLDIQCRHQQALQVYSMRLLLLAKFSGLRWLMYNHRIFSFMVFTTAFWAAEVFFALVAWILLQSTFNATEDQTSAVEQKHQGGSSKVKTEPFDDDILDTDDSDVYGGLQRYSTYDRRAPVRHEPQIKKEDDDKKTLFSVETRVYPKTEEADDESEEPTYTSDIFKEGRSPSGVGTSFSESKGGVASMAAQGRRSRTAREPSPEF